MSKKKTPFSVFQATLANVDEIEGLLYPHYFEESGYSHLDYSPENCKTMIASWINDGIAYIIRSKGKIVAFGTLAFMKSFYEQIEADVDMFFVLPEYRATGIARVLADTLSRTAEMNGAKVMYTSCLSGIGTQNNSMYVNLWKKFGFRPLGTVMVRS